HLDRPSRHHLDTRRVLPIRSARPLHPNLPRHHRLQRQLDGGRHIPDERYCPALAHRADRRTYGLRPAHAFPRHIPPPWAPPPIPRLPPASRAACMATRPTIPRPPPPAVPPSLTGVRFPA